MDEEYYIICECGNKISDYYECFTDEDGEWHYIWICEKCGKEYSQ
jgi:hypothetical protein